LKFMSDYATFGVMTSDVDANRAGQGSPFFPPTAPASTVNPPTSMPSRLADRVAAVAGLDRASLQAATSDELEHLLIGLLGALRGLPELELQFGERHSDGSLRITSHLAVWLIGKVTDAYGGKLVRLSKVPHREILRSLGGLAQLLHAAIQKQEERAGAA
jgi:hypothetical protein